MNKKIFLIGVVIFIVGVLFSGLLFSVMGYSTTGDSYISREIGDENENFGSHSKVFVDYNKRGLFSFEFEVSENITNDPTLIESAYLELYAYELYIMSGNGSGGLDTFAVSDDWNENTVTWSNFPGFRSNVRGEMKTASIGSEVNIQNQIVSFKVTEIVRYWAANMDENHGIVMVAYGASGVFASKESGDTKPSLVITYKDSDDDKETVIIDGDNNDENEDVTNNGTDKIDNEITEEKEIPLWSIILMILGGGMMIYGFVRR